MSFASFRRHVLIAGLAALVLAGALSREMRAQELSIPKPRRVVVTIDDGPAVGVEKDLDAFLRIARGLRESFVAEKVPAIMFVNERQFNIDGQRDARVAVLPAWLEAGLALGNHTYAHPHVGQVKVEDYLDGIVKGEVITRPLVEAHGQKLKWFRYPFLETGRGGPGGTIESFLAQRGYRIAPVTVDYHDYSFSNVYVRHLHAGDKAKAEEQFAAMLAALDVAFARSEKRSMEVLGYELPQVLLIHCNEMNALTLPVTLQRIRARGYAFVSLEEAMADPAYQLPLRPGQLGGGGLFESLASAKGKVTIQK